MSKVNEDDKPSVYLASRSPQRQLLLRQLAVPFILLPTDIDERRLANEACDGFVLRLAKEKAQAAFQLDAYQKPLPVIGSDTVVVLDDRVLGKPKDKADAKQMLSLLSNQTHQVLTAVAVGLNDKFEFSLSVNEVSFDKLSAKQIDAYLATGESIGRAGSYAVQGMAAQFIRHISGSYSAIMGLPLYETAKLLNQFGLNLLR